MYSNFSLCLSNQPDYTHQALAYMYKYAESARLYYLKLPVFSEVWNCMPYIYLYIDTHIHLHTYKCILKYVYLYIVIVYRYLCSRKPQNIYD